jgi:hypothetical protein
MANWAIFTIREIFPIFWMMKHILGGRVMATKLADNKRDAGEGDPKTSKAAKVTADSSRHTPNAETSKVLLEAQAGKNLIRYPSAEAMYEDLGI